MLQRFFLNCILFNCESQLSFSKGLIHYFIAEGLGRIIPLLLLPWIAVNLSGNNFGSFSLFQLYLSLGTIIILVGTDQGIFRFIPAADDIDKKKWLNTGLLFVLLSGIVLFLAAWIFGRTLPEFLFEEGTAISWYHLPLLIILYAGNAQMMTYLKADKISGFYMIAFLVRISIFYLAFIIGIQLRQGVNSFIVAYYLSEFLLFFLLLFRINFDFSIPQREYFSDLVKFSAPMMGVIIFGLLIYQTDHYLINYFLNLEKVGEYNFSYKFAAALGTIIILINHVWLPRVYEHGRKYFLKSIRIIMSLSFLLQAVVFLVLYKLMYIFINTPYLPGNFVITDIFPIIAFAYLFFGSLQQLDVILLLEKKSGTLGVYYFIIFLINIAGNLWAIPKYGIVGASMITLVSFIILWIILLTHYLRNKELMHAIGPFLVNFFAIMAIAFAAIKYNSPLMAVLGLFVLLPVFIRITGTPVNYRALLKGKIDEFIKMDKE